jgi:F0F1-type ATP synthase assembly protein I
MSANPLAVAARRSLRLLLWQAAFIVALAGLGALAWGARIGWSMLAGGSIGLLWTVYIALTLFRHSLDYGARVSAASFFKAWLLKIVLTIGLLLVAFRAESMVPLGVLGGLFGAMFAYWAWFALDLPRRAAKRRSDFD